MGCEESKITLPVIRVPHNNRDAQKSIPLVSVVVASYNAAKTLAETVECVLRQTYPSVELVVVDDGSTDDTQEILKRYSSRVRIVAKSNGGLASARNAGCKAAQGTYVALLDADDLCMPNRISVQAAFMEQHPDVLLCCSDFSAFNASGIVAESYIARYYSRVDETPGGIAGIYSRQKDISVDGEKLSTYSGQVYEHMAAGNFIHPPTVFFRRSALEKCGFWDESIVNACDVDWLVRMTRIGQVGYIDRPLLQYRLSESQMSGSQQRIRKTLDIAYVMDKTFAEDPTLFGRNPGVYRTCLGNVYLDAADALVDTRPFDALTKLCRSITLGVICVRTLKVFCKAFLPAFLLETWRRSRSSHIA